jgi:hypothetical protein
MIASPPPSPAPALPPIYRAVALARRGDRVVLAGGGVLHVSPTCTCEPIVPGRAVALELDKDGVVIALHPAGNVPLQPASKIPARAFAFPTISSTGGDPSVLVTITIVVAVPPQTPPADTVYIATERSNWNVTELRMNRLDALHWTLTLTLPRGAHFEYRYSRGSFSTSERDQSFELPKPHVLTAAEGLKISDTIANWADVN